MSSVERESKEVWVCYCCFVLFCFYQERRHQTKNTVKQFICYACYYIEQQIHCVYWNNFFYQFFEFIQHKSSAIFVNWPFYSFLFLNWKSLHLIYHVLYGWKFGMHSIFLNCDEQCLPFYFLIVILTPRQWINLEHLFLVFVMKLHTRTHRARERETKTVSSEKEM